MDLNGLEELDSIATIEENGPTYQSSFAERSLSIDRPPNGLEHEVVEHESTMYSAISGSGSSSRLATAPSSLQGNPALSAKVQQIGIQFSIRRHASSLSGSRLHSFNVLC